MHALYVVLSAITALILSFRSTTRHRLTGWMLSFWILGGSIIHESRFDIPLPGLGGGVQIVQLTCYIVVASLLLSYFRHGAAGRPEVRLPNEKYLLAFFLWFSAVVGYHYYTGDLAFRDVRGLVETSLMVVCGYLLVKRFADTAFVALLARSLVIAAAVSSAVAVVQFTVDPDLLRVGGALEAFGGRARSNGIYASEYIHSYMVVAGLLLTLLFVRRTGLRTVLVPLFLVGIALSFHRMSWLITVLLGLTYLVAVRRKALGRIVILGGAALFVLYAVTAEIIPVLEDVQGSELYQSRLSSDTMTDRLRFYSMVIDRAGQVIVMGAGTKKSEVYYSGMMSLEMGREWASGARGGIHNLYLETLFLYGLPLLLILCLFLFSSFVTMRRLFRSTHPMYFFPLAFILMYVFMNLTNSFPLNGDFGFLLALVLGSSAVYVAAPAAARGARKVSTT